MVDVVSEIALVFWWHFALSLVLDGLAECNKNDAGSVPKTNKTEAWRVPKCEKQIQKFALGVLGASRALVGYRDL